jgi:hypothetical protein
MIWFSLILASSIIGIFLDIFYVEYKNIALKITLALMTIISGFRSEGGEDFIIYRNHFNTKGGETFEVGYEWLVKIISEIGISYSFFNFFIELFFFVTLYFFIKRFSKFPNVSLFFYITPFFIYYNLIATRQSIALAFFLISVLYLSKNRKAAFISVILFGSLFHYSLLIALVILPMFSFPKQSIFAIILFFFVGVITGGDLNNISNTLSNLGFSFVGERLVWDYLQPDREFPISTFIRVVFTFILVLFWRLKNIDLHSFNKLLFSLYTLYIVLFFIFNKYDIMMRLWVYFEISTLILIPLVISNWKKILPRVLFSLPLFLFYALSYFNKLFQFDNGALIKMNLSF